ncbi:MAG: pyruvate formate lyase family protein, partial [Acutalibacteraceae bacterium]|nr:pyruvate formate lyase family protein [Acutalibacteraceae bacterium]
MNNVLNSKKITEMAKALFAQKRAGNRLDGWFIAKEAELELSEKYKAENEEVKKALILRDIVKIIPINISEYQLFAGTQDDAFARSYALINPSFKVEEFSGYCDPAAVFSDIEPDDEFTAERIEKARNEFAKTEYAVKLGEVYGKNECYTKEVIFFFEQVTGHLIPDMRFAIRYGIKEMLKKIEGKEGNGYKAFSIALESAIILANRYADLAAEQAKTSSDERKAQLEIMEKTLRKVPENGAENLCEAIQSFIIIWQIMCLEQTPNPFAFSVGNADRIFEPYRNDLDRDTVASLLKHFLVFFNVGDRSWAISQNLIVSGRDKAGNDLTNDTTYALLDAYYDMNLP